MPIRKTVRIYDLARELKQDTKRVMEDLRRAGADVSVASNSVPIEFADKVRSKYFPKADTTPKRQIKVIKASKKEEAPTIEETPVVEEVPQAAELSTVEVVQPVETPTTVEPKIAKIKRRVAPKPEPVAEAETSVVKELRPKKAEIETPLPELPKT